MAFYRNEFLHHLQSLAETAEKEYTEPVKVKSSESLSETYKKVFNEQKGGGIGGFGGGGGVKPRTPQLTYNQGEQGLAGGTPDPWYVGWMATWGQIWWNLMYGVHSGPDVDWGQLQGMVSGVNGWIWQTPIGNFNITWVLHDPNDPNSGGYWTGFPADLPWPE